MHDHNAYPTEVDGLKLPFQFLQLKWIFVLKALYLIQVGGTSSKQLTSLNIMYGIIKYDYINLKSQRVRNFLFIK